jgi:hypothetical protein
VALFRHKGNSFLPPTTKLSVQLGRVGKLSGSNVKSTHLFKSGSSCIAERTELLYLNKLKPVYHVELRHVGLDACQSAAR